MTSNPSYAVHVVNLDKNDLSPFKQKSDEETITSEKKETEKKKDAKLKKSTKILRVFLEEYFTWEYQ